MNEAKYAAARRLNEMENALNLINENVASLQHTLNHVMELQARTAEKIAEQRKAVAAIPD